MEYWRGHRTAKTAWLFGGMTRTRARLEAAMERGDVVPKDPAQVQATPPRLIGLSPLEQRRELIRQRAHAMRAGR